MHYRMVEAAAGIRTRWAAVSGEYNERGRRRGEALGRGGIAVVAEVTGLDRATIRRGLADLTHPDPLPPAGRQRRPGGGRKPRTADDPTLAAALLALVEPTTRGDPESLLRWTCKSLSQLATALQQQATR